MKCKSRTWLFIGLFPTFEIDLIFTPNFKCRRRQTSRDRIQKCIQPLPTPLLPSEGRRRKQRSQKYRKLFLRGETTLPFPEQSISHTDILLLLYLPNPNVPGQTSSCTPACHMLLSLSWSSQRGIRPEDRA